LKPGGGVVVLVSSCEEEPAMGGAAIRGISWRLRVEGRRWD